jgi:hypothetical protein
MSDKLDIYASFHSLLPVKNMSSNKLKEKFFLFNVLASSELLKSFNYFEINIFIVIISRLNVISNGIFFN